MIELTINGQMVGHLRNARACWQFIDEIYTSALPGDQYALQVNWQLLDLDTRKLSIENMHGGLWFSFAESPDSFAKWLNLFGWKYRLEAEPTP